MQSQHRAVVIATEGRSDLSSGTATPLEPLIDRPFVQHVVECLVEHGFKRIDFMLNDRPEQYKKLLGDGERWGADFEFHLVGDNDHIYRRIANLGFDDDESFMIVEADRLQPTKWEPGQSAVFCCRNEQGETEWAGAALVTASQYSQIGSLSNRTSFANSILEFAEETNTKVDVDSPLRCNTFQHLLQSQARVFAKEFPELLRFGREVEEGVWIGRNVALHPSITVNQPVFIGPNCEVESRATIGPNVVLSDSCFVNAKCEVRDSLLLRSTLLGEGLEVENCVVDRNQLLHLTHGVAVSINDDLLIGSTRLRFPGAAELRTVLSRVFAIAGIAFCWPLLLVIASMQKVRYGTAFQTDEVVRLNRFTFRDRPTKFKRIRFKTGCHQKPSNLRHLLYDVLPGMINVARGDMGWFGVSVLSQSDLDSMLPEWQEIYNGCQAGLITESAVMYGSSGLVDERVTAEIFGAVVGDSITGRLRRLVAYLESIVLGPRAYRNATRQFRTARAV